MKWSTALRGQPSRLTVGSAGRCGATNAQCLDIRRPASIQRRSRSICCGGQLLVGLRRRHALGRVVGREMRATRSLSSACRGRWRGRRRAAWRGRRRACRAAASPCAACSSGPWQAKQLSDRIGRISRLKSSFLSWAMTGEARNSRRAGNSPVMRRHRVMVVSERIAGR